MCADVVEPVDTGLSDETRKTFAASLSQVLDDTYSLLVQTHLYHWNVRGPLFADIHKLLEEQYQALFESVDEVAERVRQLGYPVPGKMESFPTGVRVPASMPSEEAMIADLVSRHEGVTRKLRKLSTDADDQHDYVTQDLANEMLAFHEKAAWMLRSIISSWPQRGASSGSGKLRAVEKH
jgi:starvation-inducible DNA-binding protein